MKILIIQVLRMGDALQLVPIIKGIKQCFPYAEIYVLTSTLGASVLEGQKEIKGLFVLHKEVISGLLMTGRKGDTLSAIEQLQTDLSRVSCVKWDWVINFNYTFSSALLGYLLDARHYSGFMANAHRQYISREKWFAYSLASFVNRRYSNFNWVDIYRRIIGLGPLNGAALMVPMAEDVIKASACLKRGEARVVGMHPGASGDFKRWPLERFGELGRRLVGRHGYRIVIFGGKDEKELGHRLKNLIGDGAENLTGQTALGELKAYLSLCDLLVTNDTGPMHLASAVGTRTVGLFFTTHFVETGPYAPGHIAVHPDIPCFPCQGTAKCPHKRCLDYITPETVEAIVVDGYRYQEEGGADFLKSEKGRVRVYYSAVDPWGFMEWRRLDNGPIRFQDIERILLKVSWLSCLDIIDDSDHSEQGYVSDMLGLYAGSVDGRDLERRICEYQGQLLAFKDLLEEGRSIAFDIQRQMLETNSDGRVIRDLGERLNELENNISSFDTGSSISFLRELLAVFQENMERIDPLSLSTKTIIAYGDIISLSEAIMKRAGKIIGLFSEKRWMEPCCT